MSRLMDRFARPLRLRTTYRQSLRAAAGPLAFYLSAHALDLGATYGALAHGAVEHNPLTAWALRLGGWPALVLGTLVVTAITAHAAVRIHQYAPRFASALLLGIGLALVALQLVGLASALRLFPR
jgi:hypothetical protein